MVTPPVSMLEVSDSDDEVDSHINSQKEIQHKMHTTSTPTSTKHTHSPSRFKYTSSSTRMNKKDELHFDSSSSFHYGSSGAAVNKNSELHFESDKLISEIEESTNKNNSGNTKELAERENRYIQQSWLTPGNFHFDELKFYYITKCMSFIYNRRLAFCTNLQLNQR